MRIYSVSEFNSEVNGLLADFNVVVQGEIANFKISQNKFVWFDLKDDKSYFSCFMMAFSLPFELTDGMEIQVIGTPGLFVKSGKFHFKVKQIKLVGEGALKKQYELLKSKLEKEGLFAPERKREIVKFPKKIGLITSQDAAAYTDVLKILKNRWAGLEIYFYPVSVQGQTAISDIQEAFYYFNNTAEKLDAIILTRGGGSMEDLWAFNTEEVCRSVFAAKFPVISAVGHERDVTLCDLVADVRAATPSNAAEIIVPDKSDVIMQINSLITEQKNCIKQNLEKKQQLINNFSSIFDQLINRWQEKINSYINLLNSLNPNNILKRGYSITKLNGKILRNAKNVQAQQIIETKLFEGSIKAKVI